MAADCIPPFTAMLWFWSYPSSLTKRRRRIPVLPMQLRIKRRRKTVGHVLLVMRAMLGVNGDYRSLATMMSEAWLGSNNEGGRRRGSRQR
jgi:hypothetical protein